jgi:uncharacterized membrane-anchored protein
MGVFVIPAARQPFIAPQDSPTESKLSFSPRLRRRRAPWRALDARHLLVLAEGALVVIGAYALIGAGIGLLAGSVMVGVMAGLVAGACAVGAILLIRGSAVAAADADTVGEEMVPVGGLR